MLRKLAPSLLLLILCGCHPEPEQRGEILQPAETDNTAAAIRQAQEDINRLRKDHVGRDAHAKSHGCARALFTVGSDIPAQLRYGLFATPGASYKSWIRFSNGSPDYSKADTAADSRGIAIKLMDVPGPRLLEDRNDPHSLDLLLIDSPAFLAPDGKAYIEARGSKKLSDYFFNHTLNPLRWRWRELNLMRKGFRPPPPSPLAADYFGVLPYKLGPGVMKFQAQTCAPDPQRIDEATDPDLLGKALTTTLKTRSACFNLRVQLQNPAANQHIEDATEIWQEKDSPWITVAHIELPVQDVIPGNDSYCENLSFNPWRTLPEQRPLGELNRMRKTLYTGISAYRHQENKAEQAAPRPW